MLLPMFPLGSVVVPTMVVPLQIFEDRYRQMIRDLMAGDSNFGSVWIEQGAEVGGGDRRSTVGTLVHVQEATELADGNWVMVGVGLQRIRVIEWLVDDPYPRAEVEIWADSYDGTVGASDPRLTNLRAEAIDKWHGLVVAGGHSPSELPELNDSPDVASLQMSALLPLASQDAYRLLASPGPLQRLELLHEFLDGIALVQSMQDSP